MVHKIHLQTRRRDEMLDMTPEVEKLPSRSIFIPYYCRDNDPNQLKVGIDVKVKQRLQRTAMVNKP